MTGRKKPNCSVQGCKSPARSFSADLCPRHYHRQYRHGQTDRTAHGSGIGSTIGKYRYVIRHGHPLADSKHRVREHRLVLFDSINGADPNCYHCGRQLFWSLMRFAPDAVQVDHLNRVRDDNRIENLVASCRKCNVARGQEQRHDALVAAGWWSEFDTRHSERPA